MASFLARLFIRSRVATLLAVGGAVTVGVVAYVYYRRAVEEREAAATGADSADSAGSPAEAAAVVVGGDSFAGGSGGGGNGSGAGSRGSAADATEDGGSTDGDDDDNGDDGGDVGLRGAGSDSAAALAPPGVSALLSLITPWTRQLRPDAVSGIVLASMMLAALHFATIISFMSRGESGTGGSCECPESIGSPAAGDSAFPSFLPPVTWTVLGSSSAVIAHTFSERRRRPVAIEDDAQPAAEGGALEAPAAAPEVVLAPTMVKAPVPAATPRTAVTPVNTAQPRPAPESPAPCAVPPPAVAAPVITPAVTTPVNASSNSAALLKGAGGAAGDGGGEPDSIATRLFTGPSPSRAASAFGAGAGGGFATMPTPEPQAPSPDPSSTFASNTRGKVLLRGRGGDSVFSASEDVTEDDEMGGAASVSDAEERAQEVDDALHDVAKALDDATATMSTSSVFSFSDAVASAIDGAIQVASDAVSSAEMPASIKAVRFAARVRDNARDVLRGTRRALRGHPKQTAAARGGASSASSEAPLSPLAIGGTSRILAGAESDRGRVSAADFECRRAKLLLLRGNGELLRSEHHIPSKTSSCWSEGLRAARRAIDIALTEESTPSVDSYRVAAALLWRTGASEQRRTVPSESRAAALEEMFRCLERARGADANDAELFYLSGLWYTEGGADGPRPLEAVDWFRRAEAAGSAGSSSAANAAHLARALLEAKLREEAASALATAQARTLTLGHIDVGFRRWSDVLGGLEKECTGRSGWSIF